MTATAKISHKIDSPKDNRINMSWYSEECEDKRHYFLHLLNEYRQNDSNENRKRMVQARTLFKSCARKCRLNHDKEQTTRLLANKQNNVKAYWKLLKGASNTNDPNISCSEFANYFKCVNNPTSPFFNPDEDVEFVDRYVKGEFEVMFDELNIPLNCDEIMMAIDGLHHSKSSGPDCVLNEYIISGKNVLCRYLWTLFNTIFMSGHFPQSWVDGCIILLHKKGSINNVNNYRGITLLGCLEKLFTNILNSRLY